MTNQSPLIKSLSLMIINGNRVELPSDVMFKNYAEVKKTMQKAGGKYSKNGFVFDKDPTEIMAKLLGGGKVDPKKEFQFFPTPDLVVEMMLKHIRYRPGMRVLEPSAGNGNLVESFNKDDVSCVELNPDCRQTLTDKGYILIGEDFMKMTPAKMFDIIIANPPFTRNQDVDHVLHMLEFLKDGGVLVTIMSPSWTFGSQKKQTSFKSLLNELDASVTILSKGAFKESGTNVSTVMVVIRKGGQL